jgi:hypothetical protein
MMKGMSGKGKMGASKGSKVVSKSKLPGIAKGGGSGMSNPMGGTMATGAAVPKVRNRMPKAI